MEKPVAIFHPLNQPQADRVSAFLDQNGFKHELSTNPVTAFPSFQNQPWGEIFVDASDEEAAREKLATYIEEVENAEPIEDINTLSGEMAAPTSVPPQAGQHSGRLIMRMVVVAGFVAAAWLLSDYLTR